MEKALERTYWRYGTRRNLGSEFLKDLVNLTCKSSEWNPSQVVERGHDHHRRLGPLGLRRALLRPHVAVALRQLHPVQDRHGRREVCDVGGGVGARLQIPEKEEQKRLELGGNTVQGGHIGLKARIGFSRSVYGKPSIPQDSTHSPLSHYIPCISRLQRPHLTFRHLSLV